MGLLTDFIIADPSEASAIFATPKPWEHWPTLQSKGLDNSALAALAQALGDEEQALSLEAGETLIQMRSDEGPWLFLLPDSLLRRVADMPDNERPALLARWAGQDEMTLGGWTEEDVGNAFAALRPWFQRALESGKPLLLWMSL